MVSYLLFSLSALCLVAMFIPQRQSAQPRQDLETYYVCDPESLPNPPQKVALPALVGEPRG